MADIDGNAEQKPFFARVPDSVFWADKERVSCMKNFIVSGMELWNFRSRVLSLPSTSRTMG